MYVPMEHQHHSTACTLHTRETHTSDRSLARVAVDERAAALMLAFRAPRRPSCPPPALGPLPPRLPSAGDSRKHTAEDAGAADALEAGCHRSINSSHFWS